MRIEVEDVDCISNMRRLITNSCPYAMMIRPMPFDPETPPSMIAIKVIPCHLQLSTDHIHHIMPLLVKYPISLESKSCSMLMK